jgi:photosystem II stability/assembly factor-like uncharacterized protein
MMKYILILFLFSLMNVSVTHSQWVQTNGPEGGKINCFAVIGKNTFAGTGGGGVFLSKNNGANWTAVNNGLSNLEVHALAVKGANLFAGTFGGGVFFSANNGTSWTEVNNNLTATSILSLALSDTYLFAGTYAHGVWRLPVIVR